MDGGGASGSVVGGGPAPFLIKTYEMVDDSTTDAIVSWSRNKKSFVVWDQPEFQRLLLPSYFKHNNFSSFIRQLNTYGFRKVDPEKWEFANEEFVKDKKHLLNNIHRRKPVHSHTLPQGSIDPERAAFEEEIDKLSREKTLLEEDMSRFKEQQYAPKSQLENITLRIGSMEQKQSRLLSFFEKAVQNPYFVERLARKLEMVDFSAYNKKRRLPGANHVHLNALLDNQSSSRPDSGPISHQDLELCDKLRLELSPAVSVVNLLSHSTQSSNEDMRVRTAGLDLSDTGTSFTLKMNSSSSCKAGPSKPGSPKLHLLQQNSVALDNDEGDDGHLSCLLNLSLASSSPLELNISKNSVGGPLSGRDMCLRSSPSDENSEVDHGASSKDVTLCAAADARNLSASVDVRKKNQGLARINDVFWEQFLTERPGQH
ncbi:hypothetical protein OROMI_011700 [Orobanche minor]